MIFLQLKILIQASVSGLAVESPVKSNSDSLRFIQ